MAAKVKLKEGARDVGSVTIFDAEPSIEILMIAFPDAIAYLFDDVSKQWTVDLGGALAPLCAD